MHAFPFHPCTAYGVRPNGEVVRLSNGKVLQPSPRYRGYLGVTIWKDGKRKTWCVHQMVALVFHGPRPSPKHQARHLDGDKTNNHYTNIKWGTALQNARDKIRHGTALSGERHPLAKLTDRQVRQLIARRKRGEQPKDLAKEYGLTGTRVWQLATQSRKDANGVRI